MTNLVKGLRMALGSCFRPSRSTLPDMCARADGTPVLLAARRLPSDSHSSEWRGQRSPVSPRSSKSVPVLHSSRSAPSSPHSSRSPSLSEPPCQLIVTADVHVDAEASDVDAALDVEIAALEAEIAELDAKAAARDAKAAACNLEIAAIEARIAELDANAAARNVAVAASDAESAVGDAEAVSGDAEAVSGDAEAVSGDAEAVAEEGIIPIPPVAGLRECAAEQLTLTLCNEKGQLMARPMAVVLSQLNSLADTREVDYYKVLLQKPPMWRKRAPASKSPTPEWLRKARDYGAARLRKESAKAGQTAWELN